MEEFTDEELAAWAEEPTDERLIEEMARLAGEARDKAEDSPEVKAFEAFCALMMERQRRGMAS